VRPIDPGAREMCENREVGFGREPFGLEPAHLVVGAMSY